MSVPFIGFDDRTAGFYRKVIANVMLNTHCVRMGYFPTLLCETDDLEVVMRWNRDRHNLAKIIREKAKKELDDGPPEER